MYADPQTVTINGVANTLPRVGTTTPNRVGNFSSSDGNTMLSVHQNQTANRVRREYRLTQRKIAADPLTATNKEVSASVIVSVDAPKLGFTNTELNNLISAIVASFNQAARDKLLGGEL